jgi:hypothetical protein
VVALDLVALFGRHRDLDTVLPELELQHREDFAAPAKDPALELRQLRGPRGHLLVDLCLLGVEVLHGLHQQIPEDLGGVGKTCAIDGSGQQLHGLHDCSAGREGGRRRIANCELRIGSCWSFIPSAHIARHLVKNRRSWSRALPPMARKLSVRAESSSALDRARPVPEQMKNALEGN